MQHDTKQKPQGPGEELEDRRRSRLEPLAERPLGPWQKAQQMSSCHLYWMPVDSTPVPRLQRKWCLSFLALLRDRLRQAAQLQTNLFLQMKVLHPDLMDPFLRNAVRFAPVMGLSRRRGAPLPKLPDAEYAEKLQKGQITYDHKAIQPDYCYWFLKPETEEQTQLYFGFGGLMMLFVTPAEQNKIVLAPIPPAVANHPTFKPLLADNRVEKLVDSVTRMQSPFFPRTKTVFGRGLEDELQYPGLKFIVPLLTAHDFFDARPAEIEEWFTVFDVLLTESPADNGLLLAAKRDLNLEPTLEEIVNTLRDNDLLYPEPA